MAWSVKCRERPRESPSFEQNTYHNHFDWHQSFAVWCSGSIQLFISWAIPFILFSLCTWNPLYSLPLSPLPDNSLKLTSLKGAARDAISILVSENRSRYSTRQPLYCRSLYLFSEQHHLILWLQVSGHLLEDGSKLPGWELSGAWDQELVVKKPDGKRETLWKYKEPEYLDTR